VTVATGADRLLLAVKTLGHHSEGVSLDALAKELEAPKSSLHRALATLRRAGFAEQDERGRYRLGTEFVRVAFEYQERRDEVDLLRPVLVSLSGWFSETAHFAKLEGAEVVYLAKIEPAGQTIKLTSRIGGRNPAHCTGIGKVLLAHTLDGPDAVSDFVARHGPLVRRTERTLIAPHELAEDFARARARGYALDRGESEAGVNCIAFPVFLDSPTRPTGAVSVAAVAMRTDIDRLEGAATGIRTIIEERFGPVTRPRTDDRA
jgi:IclR family transcriptional regulator, acetate operon repressor